MNRKRGLETVNIMKSRRAAAALGAALLVGACGTRVDDESVVARVGPYRFTVDEAVDLLVDQEGLNAEARVVESLAQLWIDYTLLAEAAAEDSTFSDLDFDAVVMQQLSQAMVFQLRDSVIQVDTFITDDELRARYESEAPAVELRARHIMMQLPVQASPAQRDSVQSALEAVRARIESGESFEAMAQAYSQDPGSAARGGDLGYFGRGDMVAPFEQAALALQPGQVSDVVTTPMGLHLIKLEDRRVRGFEDVAPQYRRQVQAQMVQSAESVFVSGLTERADPQVVDGAFEVVREIADAPGATFSGRAERRPLIEWEGGEVTVAEAREFLQIEPPQLRAQVAEGSDTDLDGFLRSLARRKLLVRAAEEGGLRPGRDSIDVLVEDARSQLRNATRRLGLLELDRAPGEDVEVALSRAVNETLADVVSGATQVVPLGIVGFQLREGRSIAVFEAGVGQVVLGIAEIRAARQLSPAEDAAVDSALSGAGRDPGNED
jgi:parvulin-like peptidyl-prolyl isomerase